MKKISFIIALIFLFGMVNGLYAKEVPFTQEDRDRLRNVELKLERLDAKVEQIDRRFDDLKSFLWIITGIFTTIMIANIGFAYWDRRTIIRKAKEETTAEIVNPVRNSDGALNPAGIILKCNPAAEQRGIISNGVKDIINALRELAKTDEEVAKVLKQFNLL